MGYVPFEKRIFCCLLDETINWAEILSVSSIAGSCVQFFSLDETHS